jgi:hypothetical protein
MSKVKTDKRKVLKAIAEFLPPVLYEITDKVQISGEDLFLANHTHYNGKEIEKDEMYWMEIPAYYEVNHLKRLEKAIREQGIKGIINYCHPHIEAAQINDFKLFLDKYKPYLA